MLDPDYDRWMGEFGVADLELVEPGAYAVERDAPTASRESAQEYFERTWPGEHVPEWIAEGYEDEPFLDFVIRLQRVGNADAAAAVSAGQRFLDWGFRKPPVCPIGIRL